MLQDGGEEKIKVELDNFEHGFPEGFGPGNWGPFRLLRSALPLRCFSCSSRRMNFLPSQAVRGIHVGFLILLTYGLVANFTAKNEFRPRDRLGRRRHRFSLRPLSIHLLCGFD